MKSVHKNDLTTYLSDWKMKLETLNKSLKKDEEIPRSILELINAISIQENDLGILLGYLDLKLSSLEDDKLPFTEKYQDYADAVVFLKCIYIFFVILLDKIARIIRDFYNKNEGIKLPNKLFLPPEKRKRNVKIPEELYAILRNTYEWFSVAEGRRNDLVHKCETLLILITKTKDIKKLENSNMPYKKELKKFGEIRGYIGFILCSYQNLIDDLLDHFDSKFITWYGIVASKESRTSTMMEWNSGNILWWAAKYGNYKLKKEGV
jgi:hypothetical protein